MRRQREMGKSRRGRGLLLSNGSLLRQRIVGSKLNASLDAESVALSLRNRHPEYRRYKLLPFSRQVSEVLASLHHPAPTSVTSNYDALNSDYSASSTTSHKCRICHPSLFISESRLLQLESNHLRRNFCLTMSDGSQYTSTSEADDPDPEPDSDVTKSILRDSYLTKSTPKQPVKIVQRPPPQVSDESAAMAKSSGKSRRENNMEIDVATEMATNNRPVGEGYSGNSGGRERMVWPRFADLGGMNGVIEELRMEVILPLLHPQLLSHLGVNCQAFVRVVIAWSTWVWKDYFGSCNCK